LSQERGRYEKLFYRKKALLGIAAFNYVDTSIGPYGEVAVVIPVVHRRRPLPLLPALMEASYPGFGNLVLHLPVTGLKPRDAGRGVWGRRIPLGATPLDPTWNQPKKAGPIP